MFISFMNNIQVIMLPGSNNELNPDRTRWIRLF
jgi:hypothetical protein